MLFDNARSKASIGVLSLSSILFSTAANGEPDGSQSVVAAQSTKSNDHQSERIERLKNDLSSSFNPNLTAQYEILLDAGITPETIALIPAKFVISYAGELENHTAQQLTFVIKTAHALGPENSWLTPSRWIEELGGLHPVTAQKLIELSKMRQALAPRGEPGIDGKAASSWAGLIEAGVPMLILRDMDHAAMVDLIAGLRSERFPKELFSIISDDHQAASRAAAEADIDFAKGKEFARNFVLKQLEAREHVRRPSTDYSEDSTQFEAINDIHQIFLIKAYVEFFNRPETIERLNDLFPPVAESTAEERGGLIIFDNTTGVCFVEIKQYVKDSEKNGNEAQSFKSPEIGEFVPHLGVLHTHPGGATVAGPSGYSKPTYGPGRYFPHGDTYSLAHANQKNPRLVETVVTELSPGRINIDLFLRDIEINPDGTITNSDPVRVIDLGVFELPADKIEEKRAAKAEAEAAATRATDATQLSDPKVPSDKIENKSQSTQVQELDAFSERFIQLDNWPESNVPRIVGGEVLKRHFNELRQLREVETGEIPYLLEMLAYGAEPRQLVEVHRYHIAGLSEGFRCGRYPQRFIADLGKNHVRYAAEAALSDPDIKMGSAWAKEYVKVKLGQREHLSRLNADYTEGIETLENTQDKYMLVLIKRYVDFFNDSLNRQALHHLFRPSEISGDEKVKYATPERGGLILCRDGKIVFEEILQPEERRLDPVLASEGYQTSHLQYNGVALGGLHTHPLDLVLDPRRSGDPAEVAGPSGDSKVAPGEDQYRADTGALRYFNQGNPFGIEVVIVELGGDRYNVDIYYRDVSESSEGKCHNSSDVYVLDLGIFTKGKDFK